MAHKKSALQTQLLLISIVVFSNRCAADDFFSKKIAPLLERKCLNCHNTQERKGEFSLQTRTELEASGYIVPGKPEESHLLSLLIPESPDAKPAMPRDGAPLTQEEIQLLKDWVISGAEWPNDLELTEPVIEDFNWWSFLPLSNPKVPTFSDQEAQHWIRTPIDAFVLAKLREKNLTPSVEADRRTLIRRVTYDLIGLPPTPEDIESFVSDTSADAWEKVVERLLASPQYGERWARHWLDVVRYADTCGYDKDKLRPNAWPYRDYVIRSFNEDKPYSRFVQEQLAGDILFPDTPDGILGLGFIAAGPWDFIGHVEVPETKIDGKVARNLDRDDMVTGTLNTFCSVTIQCARCHNHKFDPFTQQHYYGLQSVFAAVDRAERPYDTDSKVEKRRAELVAIRESSRTELNKLESEIRAEAGQPLAELDKQIAELKPKAEVAPKRPEYGYHSEIMPTADSEKWVEVDLGEDIPVEQIILHACHDEFGGIGAGFGFPVRFRIETATTADRSDSDASRHLTTLVHDETSADFPNPGLTPVEIRKTLTARYIRITATKLAPRQNDFIMSLAELQVITADGVDVAKGRAVSALDSIEAPDRWRKTNLVDGIWPTANDPVAATQLTEITRRKDELLKALNTPERMARRDALSKQLADAEQELNGLPVGRMVYAAATQFAAQGNFKPTNGKARDVRLLHRGNETQPGDPVAPGTIPLTPEDQWQFKLSSEHSEAERRASLAQWITREDHPLTYRSIVNRVWQYHFGRAIVDSPNDFGRMGQKPSHPELLDWLAGEFLRNAQSFKSLHRLIVSSSVYRQSSEISPAAAAVDGENQYLSRMNRRRLEAEEIRDSILAVSGRLNPEMGGPGFYLFELEKPEHSPHYEYNKFDPNYARSHRRSVYRFIVRSQPDPFMTTLDCADSSQSTPRRHETLTALQALSLLNNRFNLVMAQHFARKLSQESTITEEQIHRAFLYVTGRSPDSDETVRMREFAAEHGMAALCRLLFNLSEFVFVD